MGFPGPRTGTGDLGHDIRCPRSPGGVRGCGSRADMTTGRSNQSSHRSGAGGDGYWCSWTGGVGSGPVLPAGCTPEHATGPSPVDRHLLSSCTPPHPRRQPSHAPEPPPPAPADRPSTGTPAHRAGSNHPHISQKSRATRPLRGQPMKCFPGRAGQERPGRSGQNRAGRAGPDARQDGRGRMGRAGWDRRSQMGWARPTLQGLTPEVVGCPAKIRGGNPPFKGSTHEMFPGPGTSGRGGADRTGPGREGPDRTGGAGPDGRGRTGRGGGAGVGGVWPRRSTAVRVASAMAHRVEKSGAEFVVLDYLGRITL